MGSLGRKHCEPTFLCSASFSEASFELAAALVEQKPSDTGTSQEQESHVSLLLISLQHGQCQESPRCQRAGCCWEGWSQETRSLDQLPLTAENEWLMCVPMRPPGSLIGKGAGLSVYTVNHSVGPLSVTQKQQKKKEAEM